MNRRRLENMVDKGLKCLKSIDTERIPALIYQLLLLTVKGNRIFLHGPANPACCSTED